MTKADEKVLNSILMQIADNAIQQAGMIQNLIETNTIVVNVLTKQKEEIELIKNHINPLQKYAKDN